MGKAVGVDGISAEILKTIPWRPLQKIKKAFEMRYTGENKEDIENRLEGQTRCICLQSVLAMWYCGCLTMLLEIELRNVGKRDKSLRPNTYIWI